MAAMTLPTIVQQNQKKVAATRLKQTYSQLYQAINMAQADYGDMKNWDVNDNYMSDMDGTRFPAVDFAEKYLKPYLKPVRIYNRLTLKAAGYPSYQGKNGGIYWNNVSYKTYIMELSNGVTLFVAYNGVPDAYYTLPLVFVDINGKTKPNITGRDLFYFQFDSVSRMKIIPSGYGLSRKILLDGCGNVNAPATNALNFYCTGLIMQDGWEIKKDYPW